MRYETVEFEEIILPDGRRSISDKQIAEQPWLMDFVRRFPGYYVRHEWADAWVTREPVVVVIPSARIEIDGSLSGT